MDLFHLWVILRYDYVMIKTVRLQLFIWCPCQNPKTFADFCRFSSIIASCFSVLGGNNDPLNIMLVPPCLTLEVVYSGSSAELFFPTCSVRVVTMVFFLLLFVKDRYEALLSCGKTSEAFLGKLFLYRLNYTQ